MFCSKCGAKVLVEGRFCQKCGYQLPDIASLNVTEQESPKIESIETKPHDEADKSSELNEASFSDKVVNKSTTNQVSSDTVYDNLVSFTIGFIGSVAIGAIGSVIYIKSTYDGVNVMIVASAAAGFLWELLSIAGIKLKLSSCIAGGVIGLTSALTVVAKLFV